MKPIIRASEVGEFVFCAKAWWLRRVGDVTPSGSGRRARGTRLHARHGRLVALGGGAFWAGLALLLVGLSLLFML